MKKNMRIIVSMMLVVFTIVSSFFVVSESRAEDLLQYEISDRDVISQKLLEAMQKQPEEKVQVLVWMEDTDLSNVSGEAFLSLDKDITSLEELITREDIVIDDIQQYVQRKRELSVALYEEHNKRMIETFFKDKDVIYVSKYSPLVLLNLDKDSIVRASQEKEIKIIDLYIPDGYDCEMNIANNVTRASLVYPTYGYGGYGVKIGVLENSITNASFPGINIVSQNGTVAYGQDSLVHVNSVVAIISSIAPDAKYYIADHSNMSDYQAIEWLLDQGVNIINASQPVGNDDHNTYGIASRWLDHIAYNHDVHFVKSAGNDGEEGITSGGMAYNIITVGAINDQRDTNYSNDDIAQYSSFYFDEVLDTNLANKPDICAPGGEDEEGYYFNTGFGTEGFGTSFAAPQVTGAIALLCQGNPTVTIRQDAVKAILTCSVNFASPLTYVPSDYSYQFFGAGLLDTYGAVWVAENTRYIVSNITTNTSSKSHTFYVGSSDDRIRVSLAFLRNSSIGSTNHAGTSPSVANLSDLDIRVYPPNSSSPIAASTTSYNNVEIVDFEPTIAGTYTVVITNYSSSATTYYGLAWR